MIAKPLRFKPIYGSLALTGVFGGRNGMTKAEIIDAVYEKVGGFSKKEAAEVVEAVFDTMKDVLAEGEKIKISGFGNFVVRAKKERIGRNPQTGAPIPISARRVLTFKPSQVLKTVLNPHRTREEEEADARGSSY